MGGLAELRDRGQLQDGIVLTFTFPSAVSLVDHAVHEQFASFIAAFCFRSSTVAMALTLLCAEAWLSGPPSAGPRP